MPIPWEVIPPALGAGAVAVVYLKRRIDDRNTEKKLKDYFNPLLKNSSRLGELDEKSIEMLKPNSCDGKRTAKYKSTISDYVEQAKALKKADELEFFIAEPEKAYAKQE